MQAEYLMAEAESIKEGQYVAVNCGLNWKDHDYFLLQVVNTVHQLTGAQTDDHGVLHEAGGQVVRGNYLEWVAEGSDEYRVDVTKMCIVYTHLIIHHPVKVLHRLNSKGTPVLCVSNREHARIMAKLPNTYLAD